MQSDRIVVVSSDGHAGPKEMSEFLDYLDPGVRADYQDYLAAIAAYETEARTGGGARASGDGEGLWDFGLRERHLDADGVSAEIIFIQGSVPFGSYPGVASPQMLRFEATPAQTAAGCRAYNRWLAERCARDPKRHLGIAQVPLPDVDAAVAEVEFAARAGLRGGVLLPALAENAMPFYSDPRYEPFWSACEANGMMLNMHGGAEVRYRPGPEWLALVLVETDWFSRRGAAHLIFSGVFERHPKLHLAITEQRAHWVEAQLRDWDSVYLTPRNASLRQVLPHLPSDYFASSVFVGASFLSRLECDGRGELGASCFMWGSDYPHQEGVWPTTEAALRWAFAGDVPSAELRAMLGGNAARCYGLDLGDLAPIAARIGPTEAQLRVPIERPPDPPEGRMLSWAFREGGPWH